MPDRRINISIKINVLLRWIVFVCIIIIIIYGLRGGAYGTVDRIWGQKYLHSLLSDELKEGIIDVNDEVIFDNFLTPHRVESENEIQFFWDRYFFYAMSRFNLKSEPFFFS